MRDSQRSKVYAAEDAAFDKGRSEEWSIEELQALVDKVCRSSAIRERYPRAALPVEVRAGRGHRRAVYYATYHPTAEGFLLTARPVIQVPKWARSRWVALHELAHHLTHEEGAPHGYEFAACYLDLVRIFLSRHAEASLKAEMKARRVKYRPPVKREMTDAQRQAARERMLALNAARAAA